MYKNMANFMISSPNEWDKLRYEAKRPQMASAELHPDEGKMSAVQGRSFDAIQSDLEIYENEGLGWCMRTLSNGCKQIRC